MSPVFREPVKVLPNTNAGQSRPLGAIHGIRGAVVGIDQLIAALTGPIGAHKTALDAQIAGRCSLGGRVLSTKGNRIRALVARRRPAGVAE